jgi:murein L,D-transpeptidase YafK
VIAALVILLAAGAEPERVAASRAERATSIAELFQGAGVTYPPAQLYLRAFKHEAELELWAGDKSADLKKLRTYKVCAASGVLGPKRQRGDLQVPEGFYRLDRFNPTSNFYLSLGIDYPNAADRKRSAGLDPGGDIFIHGDCVTIGCLPIEDDIRELYVIALDARNAGRSLEPAYRLFEEKRRVPKTRVDASGAYVVSH